MGRKPMRHFKYEDKTHLFMSLESFFQVLCLWGVM